MWQQQAAMFRMPYPWPDREFLLRTSLLTRILHIESPIQRSVRGQTVANMGATSKMASLRDASQVARPMHHVTINIPNILGPAPTH